MQNNKDSLQSELADFLRSRRTRLDPAAYGIPKGRRRTAGLRREEVAEFAGISNTWYVWLEQGRDVRASPETLSAIADALKLTQAERIHLLKLARPDLDLDNHPFPEAMPSDGLTQLVANLSPHPAYVLNRYWQVVAVNMPMERLLGPFDGPDELFGNLLGCLFLNPVWQDRFVDWETVARFCVEQFRLSTSGMRDDPVLTALLTRLEAESETFRRFWRDYNVAAPEIWQKTLHHPAVGDMNFQFAALKAQGMDSDFSVSIYTPKDATSFQRLATLCRS